MKCPNCSESSGIREIIYGLPIEPIDESKYAIVGCCVTGNDPTHMCVICGSSFSQFGILPSE